MKNIYDLTTHEKYIIKMDIFDRVYWKTPLPYYINNCVSFSECPLWLWSFVCDLIFWMEDKAFVDVDLVWYYVNELFYSDDRWTDREFAEKIMEMVIPKEYIQAFKKWISKYV